MPQVMELVVKETRPKGRPKLRQLDMVSADLKEVNVQVLDAQDVFKSRNKIKMPDSQL